MVKWLSGGYLKLSNISTSTWMGDRLVGCASYTMSEFHVRNYMARRPHINQEPNVGTSTAAIMYAAPLNVILAVKPL